MKRFSMLTLVVSMLLAVALLSAPLTVWAQDGHDTESHSDGANLGALIAFSGVLAILAVGSVYMTRGEPETETDDA